MSKKKNKEIAIITLLSGLLMAVTFNYFINWLGWICYVGLIYILIKYSIKPLQAFLIGIIASSIQGMVLFTWMIQLAKNYTASNTNIGFLLTIITAIIFALKTGIFLAIASYFINKKNSTQHIIISILALASAYIILDKIYESIFQELPWLFHFIGYTQSTNLYTAQLSEIAGIAGISFIVIICNLLIAYAFSYKKKTYFAVAIGIIAFAHLSGFIRIQSIQTNQNKSIKVALICDNSAPNFRWNEQRVDEYAWTLLDLNQKAIKNNPDIIVWNEGVIPWSYNKEDDLLKTIIDQTKHSKSQQLISLFTDENDGSYNSVYLFNNNGNIEGLYHKNKLLGGLEKPLWGNKYLELPFMNSEPSSKMLSGKITTPITSSKLGDIGIMLCSESLSESSAAELTKQGAGFLVLMANDNWFTETQLIFHHFYLTRMRAIETRKDIVINTNLGYCGVINAKGEIIEKNINSWPTIINTKVETNNNRSTNENRKIIFYIMAMAFIVIGIKLK